MSTSPKAKFPRVSSFGNDLVHINQPKKLSPKEAYESMSAAVKKQEELANTKARKRRRAPPSLIAEHFTRGTEVMWTQALSGKPTATVLLMFFFFFVALQFIMDAFVVESKHSVFLFAAGSHFVGSSYFTFHFYLSKLSTSYQAIESDKQFYVLSNLIKSALLLAYTPMAGYLLHEALMHDEWNNVRIRNLGVLYAIPDFVSLLLVKRMARSTIIHHLIVQAFATFNFYADYKKDGVGRCIVVYAVFSTFAYLVNLLLASRFMAPSPKQSQIISGLALLIYSTCCLVNWTWQTIYIKKLIFQHYNWTIPVFVPLLLLIVWDDIVLMKWLRQNYNQQTKNLTIEQESKKEQENKKVE